LFFRGGVRGKKEKKKKGGGGGEKKERKKRRWEGTVKRDAVQCLGV